MEVYNCDIGFSLEETYFQYEKFIDKIVIRFCLSHNIALKCLEKDDIMSMAKIGFMKAYKTYDKSKGCEFATHLLRKVKGEIGHGYIADDGMNPHVQRRKKKDIQFNILSMDTHSHGEESEEGFHEVIAGGEQDQTKLEVKNMISLLTEREKEVLDLIQKGIPKTEIAKHFGVSREYVYQIIGNMKKKLNNYMLPFLNLN